MGEPATDDLAPVEGSVREPMTWVWSPPRVEKRVDSSPYPQLAPELGFGSGGDRGRHYGGGELWKPKQYIPCKGAREEVDPEFCGESARRGSQSRVERKRAGKPCQESCKVARQGQGEIASSTVAASVQDPSWTFSFNLGGVIH